MMSKINLHVMLFILFSVIQACKNNTHLAPQKSPIILSNYRDSTFKSLEKALGMPDSVFALTLKEVQLEKIPETIFSLKNLVYLDLSMNGLDSIPDKIASLKNLEQLIVAYGRVSYISPEICKITSLKELNFLYNRIHEVPACISSLVNLENVNFNGNRISKIPYDIHLLKKLKYFTIESEEKCLLDEKEKEFLNKLREQKFCKIGY